MQATFDNKTNLLSANVRSCVDNSVLYNISTTHNLWGRTVTVLKDANPAGGALSASALRNAPIVGAIYWRERLFEVNGVRRSVSDIKRKPPGFGPSPQQRRSSSNSKDRHRKKDEFPVPKRDRKPKGSDDKENEKCKHPNNNTNNKSKSSKQKADNANSVAHCTTCGLAFSPILTQLGLGDWWRSVTCNTRYWRWGPDRTEYELIYHHEQWKALINLPDINDETPQQPQPQPHQHDDERPVSAGASPGFSGLSRPMPGHLRARSASTSFAHPPGGGRSSGLSSRTVASQLHHSNKRHSRHSSAQYSIATATTTVADEDDDWDKVGRFEDEEDMTEEQLREERRTRASLFIPYRNHLFHKTKPAVMKMKKEALLKDEVFLLLVLIYEETKRQDRTNSSGGW